MTADHESSLPTPKFLSVDQVIALHADQIARYGGSPGLRDRGLLESAVAAPAGTFGGQFLHPEFFDMAAVYLFGLVKNHAFVDGNKRVGAAAAVLFLKANGIAIEESEPEFGDLVLAVATGAVGRDAVADFFRKHVRQP